MYAKTFKEFLAFCNEFTFYDHHNIERIVELIHIRDYTVNILSGSVFKHEDNRIRLVGNIDVISLKVKDGDVKNIEISNLSVAFLQLLCLERFHRDEKGNKKRLILVNDRGELFRDDVIESFQNRKKFHFVNGFLLYLQIKGRLALLSRAIYQLWMFRN